MEFLELARRRQSCRAYLPDPVPREALERCIEAARLAPSACNSQPWRFVVATGAARDRLAAAALSGVHSMNAFAANAPAIVAVVTEPSRVAARFGGLLRGVSFNLLDIGIACEHFVLQAEEEGLGTCWIGWFDARGARRTLGLPPRTRLDVLISVGRPAAPDIRPKQRRAAGDMSLFLGE